MEMEKIIETAHGKFVLRPYRDEDENRVIELWELAFGQKMNKDTWHWKFTNNPFGKNMMLCVAEDNTPVVMYAGIPYIGSWQGSEIRMGHIVDTMAHPNFRQPVSGRKSLMALTAEHFFDIFGGTHACDVLYGFPGKKIFKLGRMLLNYQKVAQGGTYLKSSIKNLKRNLWPMPGKIIRQNEATEIFDLLWANTEKLYPIAVKRNRTFIAWRFYDKPLNDYNVYVYMNKKGKAMAYLAILIRDRMATIVDIISVNNFKISNKLVVSSLRSLSITGITDVQIWLPKNHFINKHLLKSGFKEEPEPLGFFPVSRTFNSKIPFASIDKLIFYTMADGDLF